MRELLVNNTILQSLYQAVLTFSESSSKLNYSKNFFSEYISHNNDTLQSYYWTILTYSELISNSFYTSTELLPNNSKYLLEILKGHLIRQKIPKRKILNSKWEKLACTHETDNFAINYSWVYMIGHWWRYGGS